MSNFAKRSPVVVVSLWAVGIWPVLVPLQGPLCAQFLDLPSRPANAPSGTEFIRRVTLLELAEGRRKCSRK